jgi:hypothetical protein
MPDIASDSNQPPPIPLDPADVAIARSERKQRWRRFWLSVTAFVSLPVGYVLSPAAFVFMDQRGLVPPEVTPAFDLLYAPLDYAYHTFPAVEYFYDTYFEVIGADL